MKIFFKIYRFLLSLRYKIVLKNENLLKSEKPFLLLSNHIALVDPQILVTEIFRFTKISPLTEETFFDTPGLNLFFRKINAIRIKETKKFEDQNKQNIEEAISQVINYLENGKNILLYPAGQIAGQGQEALFAKKSAFKIAGKLPSDVKVIGVRIRGLWGSMWSRAWLGKSPNFVWTFLKATFFVLVNFIFFLPRRRVEIEFEEITRDVKKYSQKDLKTFNKFLENFYNIHGEEKPLFLKHFFYFPKLKKKLPDKIERSIEDFRKEDFLTPEEVNPKIFDFIVNEVARIKEISSAEIALDKNLILDLYFDSLDLAEFISVIKNKFPNELDIKFEEVKTVTDLYRIAVGEMGEEIELPSCNFHRNFSEEKYLEINKQKNIVQNFLDVFSKNKRESFSFDSVLGDSSRKKFLLKSIVVSKLIRKVFAEERVGIMLPALQASSLLVMATYLARKTPVMFNWTVGDKALRHSMKTAGIKKILTIKKFFQSIEEQIPNNLRDKFIFLEDEAGKIKLKDKLSGLAQSFFPKLFFYHKKYPELAVILFTSGSENIPKAVPLTHQNIISDLGACLKVLKIKNTERVLGFLPPFHSFGFAVTTILPLCTGIKVAYSPNPTDSINLLKVLRHTKASLMATSPTFLRMILKESKKQDLKSLKTVVTGADSCSPELKEKFLELAPAEAKILEGYGITECSPVLSVNPPEKQKSGSVGQFIPGVDFRICDLETEEKLPPGKEGMIFVRGKNIFSGYLDKNIDSPFLEIEGEKFYRTGDLGYVDEDGFLILTGRLKRFIKIAGEMISLPMIENILIKKYGNSEENILAVEGSDQIDPPKITLFATREINLKEVNKYLLSKGVSNLIQIHEFHLVTEIPLLGSGKIDYKVLKKMITPTSKTNF